MKRANETEDGEENDDQVIHEFFRFNSKRLRLKENVHKGDDFEFPEVLLCLIFQRLDDKELFRRPNISLSLVCKSFLQAMRSQMLWRAIYERWTTEERAIMIPKRIAPYFDYAAAVRAVIDDEHRREYCMKEKIEQGVNVFITGGAGVGKSHFFKKVIDALKSKGKRVLVTASTGIAASAINGITLHSAGRIGLGDLPPEKYAEDNAFIIRKVWTGVDVLGLDEVSMINAKYIETLDKTLRLVYNRPTQPFAGIQLIFCGDFFQLPPIQNKRDELAGGKIQKKRYAFDTFTWRDARFYTLNLVRVFRQTEQDFVDLLHRMRIAELTKDDKQMLLNQTKKAEEVKDRIYVVSHHKTRGSSKGADDINEYHLSALNQKVIHFNHTIRYQGNPPTGYRYDQDEHTKILGRTNAEEVLSLCVGAKVLLNANVDVEKGMANGTRGTVTGFDMGQQGAPIVQFEHGKLKNQKWTIQLYNWNVELGKEYVAFVAQYPLQLGWAITIHKSQGLTLQKIAVDVSRTFEEGQSYVALSRCPKLSGISLIGFNPNLVRVNEEVKKFYQDHVHHPTDWVYQRIIKCTCKSFCKDCVCLVPCYCTVRKRKIIKSE